MIVLLLKTSKSCEFSVMFFSSVPHLVSVTISGRAVLQYHT